MEIKSLNVGIDLDGFELSLLMYADDIELISGTEEGLQQMLDSLNMYYKWWRLKINASKTNIVHFRPSCRQQTTFDFCLSQSALSFVRKYKYL